jgi:type IV pilus assembly protein PilA
MEIQMKKQQGFTLIELMIVVAIIGILAAIAIPAYQDYIARSQMTEAVSLMSGIKTPAAEFYSDKGYWPTIASLDPTTTGKYVSTIAETGSNASGLYTLTATMKTAGVNSKISGKTASLTTSDGSHWTCQSGSTNGVAQKYLPAACR